MTGAIDRNASVKYLLDALVGQRLAESAITEICINRPGELWCQRSDAWERHEQENITLDKLRSFSVAVAKLSSNDVSDTRPILSAILPMGERIQIVQSPACEQGTVSVTIRSPSETIYTLDDFKNQGYFDRSKPINTEPSTDEQQLIRLKESGDMFDFLSLAVTSGKNIVIAGETNSGKTTLMKALMQLIPQEQRIITIEDVPELFLPIHPNHVHLFYSSTSFDISSAEVTATALLKCCLRMNPDRIMLAELRGGETFDYLNVAASGHGGSITSVHAGSCELTMERMALMILQSAQGMSLPHDVIKRLLLLTVDVIVHVNNESNGIGRHITELWYEPGARRLAAKGDSS